MSRKESGIVFDIQRCSIHDGPGIRTTIFLKGCPLRCKWCHNPESWLYKPEIMFNSKKCVACMNCVENCPSAAHTFSEGEHLLNRGLCNICGNCVEDCLFDGLELKGEEMDVDEVIDEVKKDIEYYKSSNGGITLSGGEPLAQAEFTYNILKAASDIGIHTCVETSGYVNQDILVKILEVTDLFLYDYKATDPARHKELTGVHNAPILKNLDYLYRQGKDIILRCPLIPGVNDNEGHLKGIAVISRKYPQLKGIEIMAYHNLGIEKNKRLGRNPLLNSIDNTDDNQKKQWIEKIKRYGCERAVIG